jgi:hypothetical protein
MGNHEAPLKIVADMQAVRIRWEVDLDEGREDAEHRQYLEKLSL